MRALTVKSWIGCATTVTRSGMFAEMDPGIDDQSVLAVANREGAVLVTSDKDFGELVYRQRLVNPGVILVRLAGLAPEAKAQTVAKAINVHSSDFAHSFAVISHAAVRIRHHKV